MGDCLQAGKLSQYVTTYLYELSLAIPLWVGTISTSFGWEGLASHWPCVTNNSNLSTVNSIEVPNNRYNRFLPHTESSALAVVVFGQQRVEILWCPE